jgi:hypothetical protein
MNFGGRNALLLQPQYLYGKPTQPQPDRFVEFMPDSIAKHHGLHHDAQKFCCHASLL